MKLSDIKSHTIQHPDRLKVPPVKTSSGHQFDEPRFHRLPNGIPVHCFCNDTYEAMRLDLVFDAGQAWQSKLLVAGTTNKMLKEGTAQMSGHRLSARLDYHGSYVDLSVSKDTAWLTLFCLKRNYRHLLPLVKSMVTTPRFSEKDFLLFNMKQKSEFAVNSQKPKQIARNAFNKLVFGEHTPYGQVAGIEDFDKLLLHDLLVFHREFYHHGNCRILLSGPIDESLMALTSAYFGSEWGTYSAKKPDFEHSFDFQPAYHSIERNGSLQCAIVMGKPMPHRTHPDYPGLMLLNTVFGGYFGSRLMANIREDKGFTYGIHSQIASLKHAAYLQIATETGKDVTEAAIVEIKSEIQLLRNERIPEGELELVKNYITGSLLRSLDGPYAQAERFKSISVHGLGMSYYANLLSAIQSTGAEELLKLAQHYLDPDTMVTVVVG